MKMYNLLAALIICPMLLSGMEEQYKIDSMQETIPESSICRNQYLPNGIKVYHLPAKNNELMIRLIIKTGYVTENIIKCLVKSDIPINNARIAIMAITTRSSISVKILVFMFISPCRSLFPFAECRKSPEAVPVPMFRLFSL